jgi:hypothetical protein
LKIVSSRQGLIRWTWKQINNLSKSYRMTKRRKPKKNQAPNPHWTWLSLMYQPIAIQEMTQWVIQHFKEQCQDQYRYERMDHRANKVE